MANFHPELYVWLCKNYDKLHEKAKLLQDFLSLYAFTESLHYPVTAKYRMTLEGIHMGLHTRRFDQNLLTEYDKMVVEQGIEIEKYVKLLLSEELQ